MRPHAGCTAYYLLLAYCLLLTAYCLLLLTAYYCLLLTTAYCLLLLTIAYSCHPGMSDSHLPPPAPLSRSRSTDGGSSRWKASKQEGSGTPSSKTSARGLGTGASAPSLGGGVPSKHWLMAKDALVQQKEAKKEVRPPHRCDPPPLSLWLGRERERAREKRERAREREPWPRPADFPSLNPLTNHTLTLYAPPRASPFHRTLPSPRTPRPASPHTITHPSRQGRVFAQVRPRPTPPHPTPPHPPSPTLAHLHPAPPHPTYPILTRWTP